MEPETEAAEDSTPTVAIEVNPPETPSPPPTPIESRSSEHRSAPSEPPADLESVVELLRQTLDAQTRTFGQTLQAMQAQIDAQRERAEGSQERLNEAAERLALAAEALEQAIGDQDERLDRLEAQTERLGLATLALTEIAEQIRPTAPATEQASQ